MGCDTRCVVCVTATYREYDTASVTRNEIAEHRETGMRAQSSLTAQLEINSRSCALSLPATNARYQVKALFSVSQLTCRRDHECSPRLSRGHRSRSPFSYRAVTTGQNCTPSDNIRLVFQARYPESLRREIAHGETPRKVEGRGGTCTRCEPGGQISLKFQLDSIVRFQLICRFDYQPHIVLACTRMQFS